MSNIICYLPIETLVRELDSKLYLSAKLIKAGFSCVIGRKSWVKSYMFSHRHPFIYFDNGLNPHRLEFYKKINSIGGVTLEIQEETIINNNTEGFLNAHQKAVMRLATACFLWGTNSKRLLLDNYDDVNEEKIPVVGYIGFDLIRPDNLLYFKKLSSTRNLVQLGYVLINTNFGCYNSQISFEESKEHNKGDRTSDVLQWERRYDENRRLWDKEFIYQKKLFDCFTQMTLKLAIKHPTTQIVLRPHPVENLETYLPYFKEFDNIHVIRQGSVNEWIVNAKVVIHHDCTTGVQAFIADKPVISYCPFDDPFFKQTLPVIISKRINDLPELLFFVKKVLEGNNQKSMKRKEEKLKYLGSIVENLDSDAVDKIVEFILRNNDRWINDFNSLKGNRMRRKINWPSYIRLIKVVLKKFIKREGQDDNLNKYLKNKFSGIEKHNVEKRIKILRGIDSSIPEIKVRKIQNSTFILYKIGLHKIVVENLLNEVRHK